MTPFDSVVTLNPQYFGLLGVNAHAHPKRFVAFSQKRKRVVLLAGSLVAGSCVRTQTRAHALLPLAAIGIDILDLRKQFAKRFPTQLAHLQIDQCRDD
jgi:hypothetical protein